MREKDYQVIKGDNKRNLLKSFLPNVFKAMWTGVGETKKKPVDEKAKASFDDVVKKIHEREDNYKSSLKADGNMGSIKRARESRENPVKQQTLSQDRAD